MIKCSANETVHCLRIHSEMAMPVYSIANLPKLKTTNPRLPFLIWFEVRLGQTVGGGSEAAARFLKTREQSNVVMDRCRDAKGFSLILRLLYSALSPSFSLVALCQWQTVGSGPTEQAAMQKQSLLIVCSSSLFAAPLQWLVVFGFLDFPWASTCPSIQCFRMLVSGFFSVSPMAPCRSSLKVMRYNSYKKPLIPHHSRRLYFLMKLWLIE